MNCKNYKTRTKNYKKIGYCTKFKKEVPLFCKCECVEYKMHSDCKNKDRKIKKCTKNQKYCAKSKIKGKKHKLTKNTDITQKVKEKVFERDNGCCVICGNNYNVMPNSHYIRRSQGGLGIEQNIFTACTRLTKNDCHYRYDNNKCTQEEIDRVINHFKECYPNWNEEELVYRK